MEYRRFPQGYALRLDPGEEVVQCLTRLAQEEDIRLGVVSALGAAGDVTIGIFDTREKKLHTRRFQGEYEVSAVVGNISRMNGEPYLHLHITIGSPVTGEVCAGHLCACVISATAEVFVQVWDGEMGRAFDKTTGLNVMKFTDQGDK